MVSRLATAFIAVCTVLTAGCSSDPHGKDTTPSHKSKSSGSGGDTSATSDTDSGATCDDTAIASETVPCSKDPDPCGLKSGYPGDEYCILPPPPDKGIQIHFGPKSYTDTDEVNKYLMKPGEEFNAYGIANIDALEDHWYNYTQIRMRPGSHHLINTLVTGDNLQEGYVPAGSTCPGTPVGGFPGTQNLIRNMPPGGVQAPENVGLGSKLAANTKLCLNHHAYNFNSDQPILREVWINVWFVDEADVTQHTTSIALVAGPWAGIPPHTQQVLKSSGTPSGDGRIINMFGHRHAATDRFAVWKNDELVYDSWNWQESVAYDYDSITKNPALNPDKKTDGAITGMLPITASDKISFECDVNNQTDNTLTFKNQLYTGEMCILFGSAVGTGIQGGAAPAGAAAEAAAAD
jgi:hypothetical protein